MADETLNAHDLEGQLSAASNRTDGLSDHLDATWVIASRIAILAVALLAVSVCTFVYGNEAAEEVRSLYAPLAVLFGFSGLSAFWIRWRGPSRTFVLLQLFADAGILTGLIWATGGSGSPFLFLYLPLVMAASLFVSRGTALATAFVCGGVYGTMVWLLYQGYLPAADGSPAVHVPAGGLALQSLGLWSAMVLVAVLTSFLTRQMRSGYMLAEESQRAVIRLSQEQQSLFLGFPEAVLVTDAQQRITSLNPAAAQLFRMEEANAVGRKIVELVKRIDEHCDLDALVPTDGRPLELLLDPAGEPGMHFQYRCREMKGPDGECAGYLVFLHDVTKLRSIEEQLAIQERMARLLAGDGSEPVSSSTVLDGFVGESTVMKKVFGLIERVAPSDATVLISGQSGTGKELVAKAIHLGGPRASKPFVPVNCGAIPDTLIESELFGHKKGSFTGADSDKTGLFRQAHGGTLFLDEIGELPLLTQAKLLRALQEKCIRPIGSETVIPVDVRIITATNRNLKAEVANGNFREDLFYRLNVIQIQLPALKDRKEDIPLLVNSILKRLVDQDTIPVVAPAVMQKLMQYDYPGNVRELENILERAVVFGGEAILTEHLPDSLFTETPSIDVASGGTTIIELDHVEFPVRLDDMLADLERRYIEVALLKSNGVKKKAAQLLGMNFRSFRYRLQKFGIDTSD